VGRSRSLVVVAGLSGALCLATGLSYLTVSPTELSISVLVTLSALGCTALVTVGVWQDRAGGGNRRLPLTVLGLLGFSYAAASALGFAGAQIARSARLEPTGLPSALHVAGFVAGVLVCAAVLAELPGRSSRGVLRPGHGGSKAT
jgi:hypothetical protein